MISFFMAGYTFLWVFDVYRDCITCGILYNVGKEVSI